MSKALTVSIASYNVEEYLENTLDSLIAPGIMDRLEVLIVDDGSKDKTAEIAEAFCEKYPDTFKLIRKENGGYGSTINAALKQASGKYFKLLDGDDWFQKDSLEGFIRFLEKTDSHIIISPYNIVHMPEKRYELLDVHAGLSETPVNIEHTGISDSVTHQELTVRTDLIRNVRITERCFYTDQEFVFESIIDAATLARYCKPVYCYQVGREGQSVSISGLKKHYPDSMKVANKLFKLFHEKNKEIAAGKRSILSRKILGCASMVYTAYMARDDVKQAKKELMSFDDETRKQYPEIYAITNDLKRAKLLRSTHFMFFSLMCRFSRR